MYILILIY